MEIGRFYHCRLYNILSYLEKMDNDASFAYNHVFGLKICQEIRLMTKPSQRQKNVQVTKKHKFGIIMAKKVYQKPHLCV